MTDLPAIPIGGAKLPPVKNAPLQGVAGDGPGLFIGGGVTGISYEQPWPGVNGYTSNGSTGVASAPGVNGVSDSGPGVNGVSTSGAGIHASSDSGPGVQANSSGSDGVQGVSTSNQHAGVSGVNNSGGMGVYGSASQLDGVQGYSTSNQHAGVSGTNNDGGFGVWANSPNGIAIYGQSNNVAAQFNGNVNVSQTVTVGGDILLSAQDCAEDFDLSVAVEASPGCVMVLNEHGELEPSAEPYDRRVAGVISGAGDFRPGLILGRFAQTDARAPIALVDKVYCQADAQYGAIAVGDILTTSATPGYAMKVSDPSRAFGAGIGKALRPLEAGQGLIPILVCLQ